MQLMWAVQVEGRLTDKELKLQRNRETPVCREYASSCDQSDVRGCQHAWDCMQILATPPVADYALNRDQVPLPPLDLAEHDASGQGDCAGSLGCDG